MRQFFLYLNYVFMRIALVFIFCMHGFLCVIAQQNLGIRNSNYAGIQGSLLNPSSIADSKLKWDLNVVSVGEVFDNTFLFAPKNSLSFFGIRKIIKGSIDEDLFFTHFDAQNTNKLYNVTLSAEILGPSFFLKIKKQYGLKVIALSNEGRELNAYRITEFKLNELFDAYVSSAFVHLRKPDADIFRMAIDISQTVPEHSLYIDDRSMFVDVAKTLGMHGIHFEGLESTTNQLKAFGFNLEQ